jgi:hypothetical protein
MSTRQVEAVEEELLMTGVCPVPMETGHAVLARVPMARQLSMDDGDGRRVIITRVEGDEDVMWMFRVDEADVVSYSTVERMEQAMAVIHAVREEGFAIEDEADDIGDLF